jgi:hypothetical protein
VSAHEPGDDANVTPERTLIQPRTTPLVATPERTSDYNDLIWTIIAASAPLVLDAVFTGTIGGHPFYNVGPFHLALCTFAISLAALVRILSHGRGRSLLGFLLMARLSSRSSLLCISAARSASWK